MRLLVLRALRRIAYGVVSRALAQRDLVPQPTVDRYPPSVVEWDRLFRSLDMPRGPVYIVPPDGVLVRVGGAP